ncbi:molybdenum cofactor biosynthesis protein A [Actinomyces urogenitalis DSM 15434]|uniref:GTP 3',8-cyclase n=5 Tax=Actinomyces urogenitalis TaxID=103621 RepID=C0W8L1_9ACTO|nr:GTP 3',8-cyclase MoaA [Actinomyces urogenitalis]ETJ04805.1 MAG: Molybdenum cofactor biosynthesis protein A [Actinomyces urogenitalis DORA_12]EEH64931.1 molybdenum cofactor biosynthesis protein A [Actinomyces urogenitalis DSM 15434]KGF01330.1 molybdenum cofactor biosynthesis protein MoaA [Actinomyces urogenitalis S6-C4]MBS5976931.1 GTP 3',8-cyclase MoaA [Actinomyces urogenitalis]MBS6072268.1 GTP 3',8-cyclase MoaA [Actinomyces urogenitalis]
MTCLADLTSVSGAPVAVPDVLVDRHGRTVRDLRLSVTDRCNLRCTYCMPAEGLEWLPTPSLLTTQEIARLARIGVERLGIERIRLTGGEPLMRKDLEEIVASVSTLRSARTGTKPDIGITTNGLGLDKRAARLRAAGLDRVNVSIDTLDPREYSLATRRDRLEDVLRGVAGAEAAGLAPIKVNAVAMPGTLDRRAARLLAECLRRGWQLRFIEHMPLGPRESWRPEQVVGQEEILQVLTQAGFTLRQAGRADRRPAALWHVKAGRLDPRALSSHEGAGAYPAGSVGIISSVTAPFCHDCDRTRVTADGRLMTCLFSSTETDLRTPMRQGATDEDLIRLWAGATWAKPLAHGSDEPWAVPDGFTRPARTMSAIGG